MVAVQAGTVAAAGRGMNDWPSVSHDRSSREPNVDTLSDVLRAVRLNGAIFFDVHASDPWVAETPAGAQIVERMFPTAEHLISYHAITRGNCWACVGTE